MSSVITNTPRGYKVVTTEPGKVTTEFFDFDWHPLQAAIQTDLGGGKSMIENFDETWTLTRAQLTTDTPELFMIQEFDGAWDMTSAFVTHRSADGLVATFESFDGDWNVLSARKVVTAADFSRQTQEFFGPGWAPDHATVQTVDGDRTVMEEFDTSGGSWVATGAKVTTVNIQGEAYASTEETFDGDWLILTWTAYTADGGVYAYVDYGGSSGLAAAAPLETPDSGEAALDHTALALAAVEIEPDAGWAVF